MARARCLPAASTKAAITRKSSVSSGCHWTPIAKGSSGSSTTSISSSSGHQPVGVSRPGSATPWWWNEFATIRSPRMLWMLVPGTISTVWCPNFGPLAGRLVYRVHVRQRQHRGEGVLQAEAGILRVGGQADDGPRHGSHTPRSEVPSDPTGRTRLRPGGRRASTRPAVERAAAGVLHEGTHRLVIALLRALDRGGHQPPALPP